MLTRIPKLLLDAVKGTDEDERPRSDRLADLLEMAELIGLDIEGLKTALEDVVAERITFRVIGKVRANLNYEERQKLVRRRLLSLLAGELDFRHETLIDAIAEAQ